MPRFSELSVAAFLDALASSDPTPGGGTAAAITGAMGASLLMMVAGLAKTRTNAEPEKIALADARGLLTGIRDRLAALADADSEAFDQVMAAYRLPKSSEEERASRKSAVQHALRAATDAPLQTLREAVEAAEQARVVAQYGNRSAVSDVRAALELLEAAAAAAAANVEINLTGLDDLAYREATAAVAVELTNRLTEHAAAARTGL